MHYANFSSLLYFMAVALNSSFCFSTVRESKCAHASVALLVASRYVLPGYSDRRVWVRGPGWPDHWGFGIYYVGPVGTVGR